MNITILGATGMAGGAILREATGRGHHAVAAARHPHVNTDARVTLMTIDLINPGAALACAMTGADAVVLTVRMGPGEESRLAPITSHVLDEAQDAQARTLVVGGAGPLRSPEDPATLVVDDPAYVPFRWRNIAAATVDQFNACVAHPNQNWIYLSPPAVFESGAGTGAYHRGNDTLLLDQSGTSHITPPDLALAVLDELEHPSHSTHFTVIEQAPQVQ